MLKQRVQTTNPKLEHHKELPLHICKLPLFQSTLPLNQCSNAPCDRPCTKLLKNCPNQFEHLTNAPRFANHAQTSPPCCQCMNQCKMRKVSTYSFSNIQNSSQDATHVQMIKLDTLQVRSDLNCMNTSFTTIGQG
jgi:hypothetical protein